MLWPKEVQAISTLWSTLWLPSDSFVNSSYSTRMLCAIPGGVNINSMCVGEGRQKEKKEKKKRKGNWFVFSFTSGKKMLRWFNSSKKHTDAQTCTLQWICTCLQLQRYCDLFRSLINPLCVATSRLRLALLNTFQRSSLSVILTCFTPTQPLTVTHYSFFFFFTLIQQCCFLQTKHRNQKKFCSCWTAKEKKNKCVESEVRRRDIIQ